MSTKIQISTYTDYLENTQAWPPKICKHGKWEKSCIHCWQKDQCMDECHFGGTDCGCSCHADSPY